MEQFYAYMTTMILNDEEFSSRLDVKDTESFLGIFMLMPEESQVKLVEAMLAAARASNSAGVDALCTHVLTPAMQGITVTPDNLVKLLPIMSMEQTMAALIGYIDQQNPMASIPGLVTLAGEQTMQGIYAQMSEDLKKMTVTEEIFVRLLSTMSAEDEEFIMLEETLYNYAPQIDATYESTLKLLGDAEAAAPASINFYAKDFDAKDNIEAFIQEYNDTRDDELDKVEYTDLVGVMMSSVSLIINVISYVLIAFVSISLVVSSIMIGIITYISVLERTKEIGILRSIGASKKDISRVFNAETLIVGLTAGLIGIIFTILLCLPINAIIHALSGIYTINAVLPWVGGVALVVISMFLTFIAGLIPSRIAAKKDPVEALRTE